jgi:hypothetical protein
MSRLSLDPPRILINKALLGIVRPDTASRMLYVEMAYFAIVYVLFYIYGMSNPLAVVSLNLRPLFGFDPVNSSVGLFDCGGINSSVACPAGTSDYRWAVMFSYFSAFRPKLSLTYLLVTLTLADLLLARRPGPFSYLKRWVYEKLTRIRDS